MPRFGVQAATFAKSWNRSAAGRAIGAASHLGFDALEIPATRLGLLDEEVVRAAAQTVGVELVCRVELPDDCSVIRQAERARVILGRALQATEALGARRMCGAFLHAPRASDTTVTPGAAALLVEVLADLAVEAAARRISLVLEPAHRFESQVVNTVAQAVSVVRAVGAENLGIGVSTLQIHIGEPNLLAGLRQAGPLLRTVRVVENTGGMPGSGAVQWEQLWQGLRELQFDGMLILDAPWAMSDGERSAATAGAQMSRVLPELDLYPEEYAAQGLAFLKAGVEGDAAARADKSATERREATDLGPRVTGVDSLDGDEPSLSQQEPPTEPSEQSLYARGGAAKPGTKSYRSR